MKKTLYSFIAIALVFGLCGCDPQSEITFNNVQGQAVKAVNNKANIFAAGYFRDHNEWLYFDNYYDNSAYRTSLAGENLEKLLDDVAIISLTDNYLFGYSFFNKTLKRMNVVDGTKVEFNVNGTYFVVDGEWIYFSNNEDNKKLYRIRIDGSDLTKLCDDKVARIVVFEDFVYYVNNHDSDCLYKIGKHGDNSHKISSKNCNGYRLLNTFVNNTYFFIIYFNVFTCKKCWFVNNCS